MAITLKALSGDDIHRYIPELARLRIEVFREYPYLYDGSIAYEEDYLQKLMDCKGAVLIIAMDGKEVIGASTGLPMAAEAANIQSPWLGNAAALENIFYFGESVLKKAYRGQGIGKSFFREREQWVQQLGGFELICFCAVVRPANHPLRPDDYKSLDSFWQKRGYEKAADKICFISWLEIGQTEETAQPLVFWFKKLPATGDALH